MLNKGIILEDCLISFLILSTFLLLMSQYMSEVYDLKQDIGTANQALNQLKLCIISECNLSSGANVREECQNFQIKKATKEICVWI